LEDIQNLCCSIRTNVYGDVPLGHGEIEDESPIVKKSWNQGKKDEKGQPKNPTERATKAKMGEKQ
jgi:hypothetical protein